MWNSSNKPRIIQRLSFPSASESVDQIMEDFFFKEDLNSVF